MDIFFNPGTWAAMLRIATPLLLAAMGGLMCQRAGVFNIALEGFMLIGAFAGVVVVHFAFGSVWVGFLAAMAAGVLASFLFSIASVKFKANQIIVGIAINLLGLGLTAYLIRAMFGTQGSFRPQQMQRLSSITLPGIENIPFIGQVISGHSVVTYAALVLVAVVWVILNKTSYGLKVCSVGESEEAARTAGVKPDRIKWSVNAICGALCGLAGSHISLIIVAQFSENMVQGRGFTAFTAVVFGNASPAATGLVALLFGLADAVGLRLEILGAGVPTAIVQMFPYAMAIVALTISSYVGKLRRQGRIGGLKRTS